MLILGQLSLIHHALDLDAHTHDEGCELCLLSAGFDQVAGQEYSPVSIQPVRGLSGNLPDHVLPPTVNTAFLARAPPAFLLSIYHSV